MARKLGVEKAKTLEHRLEHLRAFLALDWSRRGYRRAWCVRDGWTRGLRNHDAHSARVSKATMPGSKDVLYGLVEFFDVPSVVRVRGRVRGFQADFDAPQEVGGKRARQDAARDFGRDAMLGQHVVQDRRDFEMVLLVLRERGYRSLARTLAHDDVEVGHGVRARRVRARIERVNVGLELSVSLSSVGVRFATAPRLFSLRLGVPRREPLALLLVVDLVPAEQLLKVFEVPVDGAWFRGVELGTDALAADGHRARTGVLGHSRGWKRVW